MMAQVLGWTTSWQNDRPAADGESQEVTATRNGRRLADLPVVPEQPEPFLVWCASKLTVSLNNPARPSAFQIV